MMERTVEQKFIALLNRIAKEDFLQSEDTMRNLSEDFKLQYPLIFSSMQKDHNEICNRYAKIDEASEEKMAAGLQKNPELMRITLERIYRAQRLSQEISQVGMHFMETAGGYADDVEGNEIEGENLKARAIGMAKTSGTVVTRLKALQEIAEELGMELKDNFFGSSQNPAVAQDLKAAPASKLQFN